MDNIFTANIGAYIHFNISLLILDMWVELWPRNSLLCAIRNLYLACSRLAHKYDFLTHESRFEYCTFIEITLFEEADKDTTRL